MLVSYEMRICLRVEIAFLLGERDFGDLGALSYGELRTLYRRLREEQLGGPQVCSLEEEEVQEEMGEFVSVA